LLIAVALVAFRSSPVPLLLLLPPAIQKKREESFAEEEFLLRKKRCLNLDRAQIVSTAE
jgi:hypothetical protein